ncbi:MAG TPA: hypothetical protein VFK97_01220 [Candidatus Saccharimonadales bacterium]|nr:hypothetical protein [Candidatus Saccharimonadales bacterium]
MVKMLGTAINQFLVLGQIPGTNWQVTFSDYIALVCLAILWVVWRRHPQIIRISITKLEFWLAIISLRFKQPAAQHLWLM